jgi:galactokinase
MENNIKNFKNIFAEDIVSQAFSHARVNLIGEHTDYTSGYVLPTLLPYKTSVYISENRNATYAVYSEFFKEKIEFNDFIKSKTNEWVDYVKGCLFIFFDQNIKIKNTYINIYLESDIPMERGISSSSALCVATLKALNKFFGTSFSDKHIAVLAQKVERNYIGVSA